MKLIAGILLVIQILLLVIQVKTDENWPVIPIFIIMLAVLSMKS